MPLADGSTLQSLMLPLGRRYCPSPASSPASHLRAFSTRMYQQPLLTSPTRQLPPWTSTGGPLPPCTSTGGPLAVGWRCAHNRTNESTSSREQRHRRVSPHSQHKERPDRADVLLSKTKLTMKTRKLLPTEGLMQAAEEGEKWRVGGRLITENDKDLLSKAIVGNIASERVDVATDLLEKMLQASVPPSKVALNHLVTAAAPRGLSAVIAMIETIQRHVDFNISGKVLRMTLYTAPAARPDFALAPKILDMAREARYHGNMPRRCVSSTINKLVIGNHLAEALDVWREFVREHGDEDVQLIEWVIGIKALCAADRMEEVTRALSCAMKCPRSKTRAFLLHNMAIDGWCRMGPLCIPQAMSVLRQLHEFPIEALKDATPRPYLKLMQVMMSNRDLEGALEVFGLLMDAQSKGPFREAPAELAQRFMSIAASTRVESDLLVLMDELELLDDFVWAIPSSAPNILGALSWSRGDRSFGYRLTRRYIDDGRLHFAPFYQLLTILLESGDQSYRERAMVLCEEVKKYFGDKYFARIPLGFLHDLTVQICRDGAPGSATRRSRVMGARAFSLYFDAAERLYNDKDILMDPLVRQRSVGVLNSVLRHMFASSAMPREVLKVVDNITKGERGRAIDNHNSRCDFHKLFFDESTVGVVVEGFCNMGEVALAEDMLETALHLPPSRILETCHQMVRIAHHNEETLRHRLSSSRHYLHDEVVRRFVNKSLDDGEGDREAQLYVLSLRHLHSVDEWKSLSRDLIMTMCEAHEARGSLDRMLALHFLQDGRHSDNHGDHDKRNGKYDRETSSDTLTQAEPSGWLLQLLCVHPPTVATLIRLVTKAGLRDRAKALYAALPQQISFDTNVVTAALQAHVDRESASTQPLTDFFSCLLSRGFVPNDEVCAALLEAIAESNHADKVPNIFRAWVHSGVGVGTNSLNVAMKQLCLQRDVPAAKELLYSGLRSDPDNTYLLNAFLAAVCDIANEDEIFNLLRQFLASKSLPLPKSIASGAVANSSNLSDDSSIDLPLPPPDSKTFNILMDYFFKHKRHVECLNVVSSMTKLGVPPCPATTLLIRQLQDACPKHVIQSTTDVDSAVAFLLGTSDAYFLSNAARESIDDATTLFLGLSEMGRVGDGEVETIVAALCARDRYKQAEMAVRSYFNGTSDASATEREKLVASTFLSIMQSMSRRDFNGNGVVSLYREMVAMGVDPSARHVMEVVRTLCRVGNVQELRSFAAGCSVRLSEKSVLKAVEECEDEEDANEAKAILSSIQK